MKKAFRLPDVGEGIAEAEIVEYLVALGDRVKADQMVVRVETDKAVVELPSPFSGTVAEIPHAPGDTVRVGDALLIVETEGAEAAEGAAIDEEPKKMKGADKPRPAEEKASVIRERDRTPVPASLSPSTAAQKVLATPHTRRLARELKVELTAMSGSGPHGRITDEDVRQAAAGEKAPPAKAPAVAPPTAPAIRQEEAAPVTGFEFDKYGPTRRVPLKGVRKRVAEVMSRSASLIPHVTHFDEADVTELLHVIERERTLAESRKIKLTLLSFLAKACAVALTKHPAINASLDDDRSELVYKEYINLGFATDTDAGLMVPVVRGVERKSVLQIAEELQALSARARERSIDLEELRGGTFTISNVGSLGGQWATPIILHPQVAILGVLRAAKKPVVREDEIVVRTMLPLALSFDHRVLDGAEAARFMNDVKVLIEDPLRMLVDMA
jgi:pyruvate dehydrogenase E2 component (dihydrolipoamide acetyltransferase)